MECTCPHNVEAPGHSHAWPPCHTLAGVTPWLKGDRKLPFLLALAWGPVMALGLPCMEALGRAKGSDAGAFLLTPLSLLTGLAGVTSSACRQAPGAMQALTLCNAY